MGNRCDNSLPKSQTHGHPDLDLWLSASYNHACALQVITDLSFRASSKIAAFVYIWWWWWKGNITDVFNMKIILQPVCKSTTAYVSLTPVKNVAAVKTKWVYCGNFKELNCHLTAFCTLITYNTLRCIFILIITAADNLCNWLTDWLSTGKTNGFSFIKIRFGQRACLFKNTLK